MKNKHVLVIGLGVSGRAAADFLIRQGATVVGVDGNLDVLQKNSEIATLKKRGLTTTHENAIDNVTPFNLVVVSPGVPQTHPLYQRARQKEIEVVGEVELACRFLSNPLIGITGTNGKTTVTLLVTHVLNHSGKPACALGNLGVPLTAEVDGLTISRGEIVVAELSSFQLETLHRPIMDAAVVLNITPDHLDRYPSMHEYAAAKMHIARCVKPGGTFLLEEASWKNYGYLLEGIKPKTYGYASECWLSTDLHTMRIDHKVVCPVPPSIQNRRSHDLENTMAAFALCQQMGVTPEQFLKAFETFKKPAHRVEFVGEANGVTYYDDSKGTNLDAVIRAVHTLQGGIHSGIHLIAGGLHKGAAYTPWIEAFGAKVKCIYAIGQAAPQIEADLARQIPVERYETLEMAVRRAATQAKSGEIVLLSPGCSSYDMFRDYAHRGEEYQRVVKQIISEGKP